MESRIERARLRYLALGAALTVAFAALDFLRMVGIPFPTLGPIVSTLYLFFLAQTLLRLRLMDLHELLGKIASQAVQSPQVIAAVAGQHVIVELIQSRPDLLDHRKEAVDDRIEVRSGHAPPPGPT